ncbi:hypothetical protein JB92DRAFT_1244605 [Gautieria morchelliformis]|nr:hypothetical protein JB92DRAFT_1244605 [Gautieria morchelliformis]
MKCEDDDSVRFASPFTSEPHPQLHLHPPLARVASVPPPSSRPQGMFDQWRGGDLDAHDADGDAEMMPPTPHEPASFAMPAPATPTPMSHFARLPASGTGSSSFMYDNFFPPASPPPPPPMSLRLAARRSSSCPPLPPPGMFAFPFGNPSPWASMATSFSNAYADLDAEMYQSPSDHESPSPLPFRNPFSSTALRNPFPSSSRSTQTSRPSSPPAFTNPFPSSSPFAFAFPGFAAGDVHAREEVLGEHRPLPTQDDHRPLTAPYEHRPLTAPDHHFLAPRHMHMHMDASSRLMHRRGSSLDRAIASSSIAGAFGGPSRSNLGVGYGYGHGLGLAGQHGAEEPHHHQHSEPKELRFAADFNAQDRSFPRNGLAKVASAASLGSSDTGTPALSPSPPSSFEGAFETQARPQILPQTQMVRHQQDNISGSAQMTGDEGECSDMDNVISVSGAPESFNSPPSPTEPYTIPGRKVSARLFGSQGARLGFDLDLDVPLSLDVSFATSTKHDEATTASGPPYMSASASTSYSSINTSTSYSSISASPSFSSVGASTPYTTSSTPDPHIINASCNSDAEGESDSPSFPYTPASPGPFSYTQAMLDMGVGTDEFKFRAHTPALPQIQTHDRPVSPPRSSQC